MLMMWKLTLWYNWQPYVKKISKQEKSIKQNTLYIAYAFDVRLV